jgi:mannose-1-phosphate guanylyltransferase
MYVVIMAGGGGTRLWPLSRPDRPKPFLPLFGEESLLQATVRRLAGPELGIGPDDVFVVADRRYGHLVQDQVDARLVVEPSGRNTAAAIALATVAIDRPDDEVMLVLPADHHIVDEARFREVLRAAHDELAQGAFELEAPLVTLGIRPSRPATEFGYLLPDLDRRHRGALTAYQLRAFEEKPTPARAVQLLNEPGAAWNAGMFLWQRGAIRAALEKYTPLMLMIGQAYGSDVALPMAYERIQAISIDHAVMEGAAADHQVVMGALDVGWSDLGGWTAILDGLGIDGEGVVLQPGAAAETGEDDLVVERQDGRLVAGPAPGGTMTPQQVVALLRGAAGRRAVVQELLDRCAAWESQS